jgi:hypothetical protein
VHFEADDRLVLGQDFRRESGLSWHR